MIRKFCLIISLILHAASAFADNRPAIEVADQYVDLLGKIQIELKKRETPKDHAVCVRRAKEHLVQLKSTGDQYRFALILFNFSQLYNSENDTWYYNAYEELFMACLHMLARDKSKEVSELFRGMKSQLGLEYNAGLSHQFHNAMEAQADPNFK
jgi:hypothetical protein